ncbi:hypothetical protein LZ575_16325 [Antarcticibacterium sp. 1MA-6-2]|uniref:hypothetical protein n=1 Tax=Antarcticibacterium sp. 1MA-6-2 TaxID=2908210 RepID=UPI001F303E22|nr:hypothetical protein [Antarcticibacterium sp. 1MA-6-2]UJH90388.1 hypothetical protein LZ575_16325 [Antarcticibacterium sp. 1MA-6-2]
MTCYTGDFSGTLSPAAEIEKLEFFPYSRKAESSTVDHLILEDLKEKGWIS